MTDDQPECGLPGCLIRIPHHHQDAPTASPPAQPLDAPAVEAAKLINEDKHRWVVFCPPAARIITACYEIERKRVDGRSASSILYRKRIADLERCARAERAVREKLVRCANEACIALDAVSRTENPYPAHQSQFVISTADNLRTALAAAAELEKQDA